MLTTGSTAPPFTLKDLDGVPHSLTEILSAGPVLLAFYKISCPVCQLALPFLARIASGSLQIFAVSQDDPASTRRFQAKFGVLPTLLDREEEGCPDAVSGRTRRRDFASHRRFRQERSGVDRRPRRHPSIPSGGKCSRVEGRLKLEKLGCQAGSW
jgi:thiol-disulfide isomerase/thioredoxin